MNIQDAGLEFGSLSDRQSTERIILHHAEAESCTPEQIHAWHLARGWAGAGYHFLVRKDGSVWRLRPEWAVGAHALGNNYNSIGVCFEGDYMEETMGDAQIAFGAELVDYLKNAYGIDLVQRHGDVCDTDCPGVNFPFDEIASGRRGENPSQPDDEPSQPDSEPQSTGFEGGLYRCTVPELNVRTEPGLSGEVVASYGDGQTVELDDWYTIADGYVWGRYVGASSGELRYVAIGKPTGGPAPDDYLVKC